jgi:hypothetical protein
MLEFANYPTVAIKLSESPAVFRYVLELLSWSGTTKFGVTSVPAPLYTSTNQGLNSEPTLLFPV